MEDIPKTVAIAPFDLLNYIIIKRYSEVVDAIEQYNKVKFRNAKPNSYVVKSKVISLFNQIKGQMKRDYSDEQYNDIKDKLDGRNIDEFFEVFEEMSIWLDDKNITRFDSKEKYDYTKVEEENERHGL